MQQSTISLEIELSEAQHQRIDAISDGRVNQWIEMAITRSLLINQQQEESK